MNLKAGINKLILDLKIYVRLNFIYPGNEKFKKIKSIIPPSVKHVGTDVVIEEGVEFGKVLTVIEDGLYVGKRTIISFCKTIGKYTSISYDVKIGVVPHPLNFISTSPLLYAKRRGWVNQDLYNEKENGYVEIGNDVLISANVTILAGVKIGDGAVVGANSFINKDVPPYAIVAGIPGKILRYRFPEETIKLLSQIKWWNLSKQELLHKAEKFNDVEAFIKDCSKFLK
jgi:acetyltransferase-like isoleucine patch superfamily enzyme